uniref:Zinc finger, CCHC-type n=1 Tax=Tanacetum cinerariifolium TaxID=118510 RepID=A0A6L2JA31_TANCI|nr:zinc finger, CCHC-type [Tanacetum cinerariifolium]
MSVLYGWMFVTRIARLFRLLSKEMVNALSVKPRAWTFTKKSLIVMEVIMKLDGGTISGKSHEELGIMMKENLDPHIQIDPFLGREVDYPPFGYSGYMPHGYDYRYHTAPDGPN